MQMFSPGCEQTLKSSSVARILISSTSLESSVEQFVDLNVSGKHREGEIQSLDPVKPQLT